MSFQEIVLFLELQGLVAECGPSWQQITAKEFQLSFGLYAQHVGEQVFQWRLLRMNGAWNADQNFAMTVPDGGGGRRRRFSLTDKNPFVGEFSVADCCCCIVVQINHHFSVSSDF